MSLSILKQINSQVNPAKRQCLRLLTIGSVTDVQSSNNEILVNVRIFDTQTNQKCRVLSINGLQKYPKIRDLVLVFCPNGDPLQAIVIAILGETALAEEDETVLTHETSSLVLKPDHIAIANDVTLFELIMELIKLIEQVGANGYVTVSGSATGIVSNPVNTSEVRKMIQRFS